MRFGIAATVLACQALPVSSTIDDKKPVLSAAAKLNVDAKKTLLSAVAAGGQRQQQHTRKTKRNLMKGRLSGKTNPLTNDRRKAKEATECDPNALDMGILECGSGNYCAESTSSSKGGFCSTTQRRLQECSAINPCTIDGTFCNLEDGLSGACVPCPCADAAYGCRALDLYNPAAIPACFASCGQYFDLATCQPIDDDEDGDNYICESTVDPDTGSGIYSCYGVAEECYEPDEPCCFEYAYTFYYGDGNFTSRTEGKIAYYFTAPYSQNVSISYTVGSPDCEIVFNGETCNSCTNQNGCYYFDCTNSPPGLAGNTCSDFYTLFPISEYCGFNYTSSYEPCLLCGLDGSLANPNATIGGYTCYELYVGTYFGFENNTEECTLAQDYIGPVCCFTSGSYDPCNICGDAGMLMFPDSEISIGLNCQDLYDFGNLGFIPEAECSNYTASAGPICCDDASTDAPTGSPIDVPEPSEPCFVCPDDAPVSNPDNVVETPDQPDVTCGQLQEFGRQGLIPADLCAATQVAVPALCGCDEVPTEPGSDVPSGAPSEMTGSSESPATEPPVTPAPVTPAPITPSPVEPPVAPPTAPPTPPATDPPGSGSFYVKSAVSLMGISLALVTYMTAA